MSCKSHAFCVLPVLLMVFSALAPFSSASEDFPLLLSPEEVEGRLDSICLIDVRTAESFLKKRIPGSVWFSSREFSETHNGIPGMLPNSDALVELLAERGIGQDMPVVLYGQNDNAGALGAVARVFWALECLGYTQVAILDGGLSRWEAENRELTSEPPESPRPPATVTLNPEALGRLAAKKDVEQALTDESIVLVDARPANQYAGTVPMRGLSRNGHIPGAYNIPYVAVLSMPHAIFKPLSELKEILYTNDIGRDAHIIIYCNTGVFSSTLYFAYRLVGHESVAMYDGSLFEWAADPDLPVSTDAP